VRAADDRRRQRGLYRPALSLHSVRRTGLDAALSRPRRHRSSSFDRSPSLSGPTSSSGSGSGRPLRRHSRGLLARADACRPVVAPSAAPVCRGTRSFGGRHLRAEHHRARLATADPSITLRRVPRPAGPGTGPNHQGEARSGDVPSPCDRQLNGPATRSRLSPAGCGRWRRERGRHTSSAPVHGWRGVRPRWRVRPPGSRWHGG
jgi:hypothetical protein